jgi:hypothetical protein
MGRKPGKRKSPVEVVCENCGDPYLVPPYRAGKTRFCSFECGGAFRFRQMHASRRQPASNEQMKVCSRCGEEKPHSEFYTRPGNRDGLRGKCKNCCDAQSRAWLDRDGNRDRKIKMDQDYYVANKEEIAAGNAERYAANKDDIIARNKKWRRENAEEVSAYNRRKRQKKGDELRARRRADYRKNKGRYVAQARAREELVKRATPAWANLKAIEQFYIEAERLTRVTGIKHHVDHFYPLQGKTMCGLHVETNLQVLPAAINLRKSNRIAELAGAPLCCAWPVLVTNP